MEQALILEGDRGGFVIMGCAHPGVKRLLAAAGSVVVPYALLGGLHGFSELSTLEALDLVYPCHCTQCTQEILQRYPGKAHRCGAGLVVTI
ncbi:MAG: MBL fold metallo-hydrolase, partial [Chloroflexota bacterium]